MRKDPADITRRQMLFSAVAAFAGVGLTGTALGQDGRTFTPPLILGPFYPQTKPRDSDFDLTLIKGKKVRADGRIMHLRGRLLDSSGRPLPNRRIEIWQADSRGRYNHPSDTNKAEPDLHFQGYCMLRTDRNGNYRIKTVMPGGYPSRRAGMRTPHIHFEVHGETDRLVTQMFFPDQPLNAHDEILHSIRNESVRNSLIARVATPDNSVGRDELSFVWDCILFNG